MTASPPPPVPERSHEIWARTIKGALSQAQHLALLEVDRLAQGHDPMLRHLAQRARVPLEDGDAEGLAYADRLMEKAGPEGATARRQIVTQYECRADPRGRPSALTPRTYPVHQVIEPSEWPVWVRLLNAQGEPVSGPIWVDEVSPPPQAEDAPVPLSDAEFKRLRATAAKQAERQGADTPPTFRGRAVADALEEIRGARADWDQVVEGLAGNPAAKLLQGHRLPSRLDRALALLGEVAKGDDGQKRPGRPPGELGKARPIWEARKPEIRADYDNGMAFADLETKYGITEESMRGYMRKEGWPLRGKRGPGRAKAVTAAVVEPVKAAPAKKPATKGKAKKR